MHGSTRVSKFFFFSNFFNTLCFVCTSQPSSSVPTDAVGPGVKYASQNLPFDIINSDQPYLEVFVCNVTNPGLVWIQLKGKHTTEALETCMDQLE